jgi:hypothetical protein
MEFHLLHSNNKNFIYEGKPVIFYDKPDKMIYPYINIGNDLTVNVLLTYQYVTKNK